MNNLTPPEFDRKKNIRAAAYTGVITGALLLIFITVTMAQPQEPVSPPEEFIEVELEEPNIGSSDIGSGNDQPLLPGDPAPSEQASYTPPVPSNSNEEAVRDISTDEKNNDAPAVTKPAVSRPDATKIDAAVKTPKASTPSTQPVIAPPKPKAVLGRNVGGSGNGGNGAETYKPGTGEGVAGGRGDQGVPGGSPNGRSYSGTPKSFGVRVMSIPNQTFEDDFNQNAKVAMDVVVNENGKVISASYQPRGSTTSDSRYQEIARRSAFQLKMNPQEGGQKGTVIFNFKVRG